MDKQALILRLMETFVVELDEGLQNMNRDLLALEQSAPGSQDRERRIQSLLRAAHSIKGAARAVDIQLIEVCCHRIETILAAVQRHEEHFTQPVLQLLFCALDGLAEAGQLLRNKQRLDDSLLANVALEMEQFIGSSLKTGAAGAQAPATKAAAAEVAVSAAATQVEAAQEHVPPPSQEMLSVRIDAEKLDSLLSRSGELLGARKRLRATDERLAMLSESVGGLHADWLRRKQRRARRDPDERERLSLPEAYEATQKQLQRLLMEVDQARLSFLEEWRLLDQTGTALDEQVRRVRMLPFALCCVGFDRMVRELSRGIGKDADLQIEGGDVEIDRSILEGLKDPLRHLIRNAVDHGIEKPEERRRKGKSERGCIRASATLRGDQVQVLISDDGQGLGLEAIRRRAQKMNLPLPNSEREAIEVIFMPGFSTAAEGVTLVSGRGIGLDVVRTQIKHLHGEVEVFTQPDQGTRFQLTVPLTLTLLRVLLIRVCGQCFAVSNTYVRKLMRCSRDAVEWVDERAMVRVDGQLVPLEPLAQTMGLPPAGLDWPGKLPIMVLSSEDQLMAFLVDELIAEQEVMVKSLGGRVQRIRNIAGAVILADGQVALTLHVGDLFQRIGPRSLMGAPEELLSRGSSQKTQRRILVVDDSATTRNLERSILEGAGFLVDVVADGAQGWQRVQAGGIDVVLSDVDMPNMNGFELAETIRRSERFRTLPIILITSNEDAKSRRRGAEAGASAYIVKGEFDQDLLLGLLERLL